MCAATKGESPLRLAAQSSRLHTCLGGVPSFATEEAVSAPVLGRRGTLMTFLLAQTSGMKGEKFDQLGK